MKVTTEYTSCQITNENCIVYATRVLPFEELKLLPQYHDNETFQVYSINYNIICIYREIKKYIFKKMNNKNKIKKQLTIKKKC